MSRNKDNGIDLRASPAKKSARQFAHGGNPTHKIQPEQSVKNDVPPPAMDDYTMMMIQAMEGRS
jgi:hypothetical protein